MLMLLPWQLFKAWTWGPFTRCVSIPVSVTVTVKFTLTDRMDFESNLSVKQSVTIGTMVNFDSYPGRETVRVNGPLGTVVNAFFTIKVYLFPSVFSSAKFLPKIHSTFCFKGIDKVKIYAKSRYLIICFIFKTLCMICWQLNSIMLLHKCTKTKSQN